MPEVKPSEIESVASIKVVGVGGAGGAALNRMKDVGIVGVEFVAMNTDAQALHNSRADSRVHLGHNTTNGLGAGADPAVGEKAAEESRQDIAKSIEGSDMIFITIGAGGGTGSGAGYIVAEEAKKQGILTVGVATKPFSFEGAKRRANADWAIDKLAGTVDALITIPNDRLLQTIDPKTPLLETFKIADDVLRQGVQGISELITEHALINLDFADVKAVMSNAGSALMGIGRASGENRAVLAAQQAIESPLIEVSIDGAKGVLFSVSGGYDMTMSEIQEAAEVITSAVSPEANIIFGASIRPDLEDEIVITVVATGFDSGYAYSGTPINNVSATFAPDEVIAEAAEAMEGVVPAPAEIENSAIPTGEPLNATPSDDGSAMFTSNDNKNIWDEMDDDSRLPALLRRRRKAKGGDFKSGTKDGE